MLHVSTRSGGPGPRLERRAFFLVPFLFAALTTSAMTDGPTFIPLDQRELTDRVKAGQGAEAFGEAFEHGDELFEIQFNAYDGVGANVGKEIRFTRVPRADLDGRGEWASHFPSRSTGPNAMSCNSCHIVPSNDGAGFTEANVHRDPGHTADLSRFIQRNTPHIFGLGALQILAEEMTADLQRIREDARQAACATGKSGPRALVANGISYGTLSATRLPGRHCKVAFDSDDPKTSKLRGISPDLVIKPFQWKGVVAFIRDFARGASHNELGMQAVELAGHGRDGDGDGKTDEFSVGDQTAYSIYMAGQPRATTLLELDGLGQLDPPLTGEQKSAIGRGSAVFDKLGCASCHVRTLTVRDPVFREPSAHPDFRDKTFPGGQNPLAEDVDPAFPVSFDLTRDHPDNILRDPAGNVLFRLGSFRKDAQGRMAVDMLGDLKRHDMGPRLAEPIDEFGTGRSVFMTENLWGVGSTAPYLHDGRATTLTEAILAHGGEAAGASARFRAASEASVSDLLDFLRNQVLFRIPE